MPPSPTVSSVRDPTWLAVWSRAVIVPASRRAGPSWLGCALVAGLVFGGNGMHPRDLTGLALHHPGVGGVLAITWILIFMPTARVLVRGDLATYLRSLPAPRFSPPLLAAAALLALQLPWLALWIVGEGLRGLAVVGALTLVIVGCATIRPRPSTLGWPAWRSQLAALRAIYLRALARRAGDALVRGVGLAVLAGVTGGLFVRNNGLVDGGAATLGASVIAIVLVPAQVGPLVVLVEAHRATGWLASSLGIAPAIRTLALAFAIGLIQLAGTTIAIGAAAILADASASTTAYLALAALGVALGSTLGCTRVLLATDEVSRIASRAVVGALAVAALAVLCLGLFGLVGLVGLLATTAFALLIAPASSTSQRAT